MKARITGPCPAMPLPSEPKPGMISQEELTRELEAELEAEFEAGFEAEAEATPIRPIKAPKSLKARTTGAGPAMPLLQELNMPPSDSQVAMLAARLEKVAGRREDPDQAETVAKRSRKKNRMVSTQNFLTSGSSKCIKDDANLFRSSRPRA